MGPSSTPSSVYRTTSSSPSLTSLLGAAVQVAEIEEAEKAKMKGKVDKILAHKITCFINRQLIYNYPEQVRRTHPWRARRHAHVQHRLDPDDLSRTRTESRCDVSFPVSNVACPWRALAVCGRGDHGH